MIHNFTPEDAAIFCATSARYRGTQLSIEECGRLTSVHTYMRLCADARANGNDEGFFGSWRGYIRWQLSRNSGQPLPVGWVDVGAHT